MMPFVYSINTKKRLIAISTLWLLLIFVVTALLISEYMFFKQQVSELIALKTQYNEQVSFFKKFMREHQNEQNDLKKKVVLQKRLFPQ